MDTNLLDIISTRPHSCYPCLIHGIGGNDERIFHNIFDEHPFSAKIPWLSNKSVLASHDGWWVIHDLADKACLFIQNPLSMERIELPKLRSTQPQSFTGCIQLNSAKNPDCRIFLFDGTREVLSCQVGDMVFRSDEVRGEIPNNEAPCYATIFGGRMYAVTNMSEKLLSISVEGKSLQSKAMIRVAGEEARPSPEKDACLYIGYLIESNNELLHVCKSYFLSWDVEDFYIHKMDFATGKWTKVKTIGDHRALFLDEYSGISCNVEGEGGRIKGNRIYYVDRYSYRVNIFDLEGGETVYSEDLVLPSSAAVVVPESHKFRWVTLPKY